MLRTRYFSLLFSSVTLILVLILPVCLHQSARSKRFLAAGKIVCFKDAFLLVNQYTENIGRAKHIVSPMIEPDYVKHQRRSGANTLQGSWGYL